MIKKFKVLLLAIAAAGAAGCLAAGCSVGTAGKDEVLEGYDSHITYYGNGGRFDDLAVQELYVKANPEGGTGTGVPFFEIGKSTAGVQVVRAGYDLLGWYKPATFAEGEAGADGYSIYDDYSAEVKASIAKVKYYTFVKEEGEEPPTAKVYWADGVTEIEGAEYVYPVIKSDGRPETDNRTDRPLYKKKGSDAVIEEKDVFLVPSTQKYTKENIVAAKENLIVCADWAPTLKIKYLLACGENEQFEDANGKVWKNGDVLDEDEFGEGADTQPASRRPVELMGATFVRMYETSECVGGAVGRIPRPEGAKPEDVKVYAKYIAGDDWNLVGSGVESGKTAADLVKSMFDNLSRSRKFYIIDDIDCTGVTFALQNSGTKTFAKIEGNGHKLYNLNFERKNARNGSVWTAFGNLAQDAYIKDITFEDVSISLTGSGSQNLYALFEDIESADGVQNVTFRGISGDCGKLDNAIYDEDNPQFYDVHWLFGNYTRDEKDYQVSDAAFLARFTGITVVYDDDDHPVTLKTDDKPNS